MIRHIVAWNFKEGLSDEENRQNAEKIKKDLAVYQDHPEHKKVGAFIGSVTKHRVCLDFYE